MSFSSTPARSFGLRPKRVSSSGSPHLLIDSRAAALTRRQLPTRSGVLAFKKGMTAVYLPDGTRVPCTVLYLDRVQVTGIKDVKNHGYWAVQVGLGWRRPSNVGRPMLGHYEKMGVSPKKLLKEFRVAGEEGLLPVGEEIKADHFKVGQFVDVRADCKGKGFAGVGFPFGLELEGGREGERKEGDWKFMGQG
ncbi:translation protein [Ascodesmis nigricans]|uniref:Translation protein n=1 Tax=Ascodesmis nigricans TaxID=341454 RepID=A0A4S2N183_9PEZI|nr:translation protein [Ascodesmis nigricans]